MSRWLAVLCLVLGFALGGPVLTAFAGPVLTAVGGPVLTAVGGPVFTAVGGPDALFSDGGVVAQAGADDCCDEAEEDGSCDCCDVDLGACCAGGPLVAAVPPSQVDAPLGLAATVRAPSSWERHVHHRVRGPPPTPPPIC